MLRKSEDDRAKESVPQLPQRLISLLEGLDIHLSPDARKLAIENFAMKHKGVHRNEAWAIASVLAAIRVTDCSPISLKEFVKLCIEAQKDFDSRENPIAGQSQGDSYYTQWRKERERKTIAKYHEKIIAKYYRQILARQDRTSRPCNIQPTIYVKKYAEQLSFPKRALGSACRLSEAAVKKNLHKGRRPNVFAAAILGLAETRFGLRLGKKEIADLTGCTYVALNQTERFLKTRLGEY
jgi:hypothetical protein